MRRLLRVCGCLLLLAAVGLAGAPSGLAHTALIGSDPAADAVLNAGPSRVSATFNEDLQPDFAAMTVIGPDANLWSDDTVGVRGPVASVAVRRLGPAGRYTVNYRVTSADGHVVSGAWSFTVTAPGTGKPRSAISESTSPHAVTSHSTRLWLFVIGVVGIVTAVALLMFWRRPDRNSR